MREPAARKAPPATGKASPRPGAPAVVAAIDVGSTSARMAVTEIAPDGTCTPLEELVHPVAVGNDTFAKGRISARIIRSLCAILGNFARLARDYRVDVLRAVATSAFREAENKDLVVDRIRHETGIELEVLDNIEESRLVCQLLLPFLRDNLAESRKRVLFMELGGGSTVTMLLHCNQIVRANFRRLGTVRATREGGALGAEAAPAWESSLRHAVDSAIGYYDDYAIGECVFVNALLLKVVPGFAGVQAARGGFCALASSLGRWLREIREVNSTELAAERLGLASAEAEQLLPTLFIVGHVCEQLRLERFYVIDAAMLEAVRRDVQLTLSGKNPLLEFGDQAVRSACGIGERYGYDEKHARAVAALAGQLFDDLAGFLDLARKDRLFLEIAAILHDIGMFVSEEAHHKHSQYLIQWSDIVGFSRADRGLIALIARYHRKAEPLPSHEEYARLNRADRLRVCKLAAILRVADALDRSHQQPVRKVRARVKDDQLLITAVSKKDLTVEERAFREKSSLLNAVTGLTMELRRK